LGEKDLDPACFLVEELEGNGVLGGVRQEILELVLEGIDVGGAGTSHADKQKDKRDVPV
jgi:hypothetical protein